MATSVIPKSLASDINTLSDSLNGKLRIYSRARTYNIKIDRMSALLVYGCGGAQTPFMFLVATSAMGSDQAKATDIITSEYYPHTVTKSGDTLTIEFTGGEDVYSGLYVLQMYV